LWVHPDDVALAQRQVTCAIPCLGWDEENQCFKPPTDPVYRQLYDLMMAKQIHRCRSNACRRCTSPTTEICNDGFPRELSLALQPVINPRTDRYSYFCPSKPHEWASPTSILFLFGWGSHGNVQCIRHTSWSQYLLKYSMKSEPTGVLRANPELASRLGLDGFSNGVKVLASALWLAHPVPACEAALIMLEIPIVSMSSTIDYIASNPPNTRTNIVRGSQRLCRSACDKYMGRPQGAAMDKLTFYK
jgi:hypothetical protein